MKFPGIALLDVRSGHPEKHAVHAGGTALLIGWPPYFSLSWRWPKFLRFWPFKNKEGKLTMFWFYLGWEPEDDHFDFTWWALRPFTTDHMDRGRDYEDCE